MRVMEITAGGEQYRIAVGDASGPVTPRAIESLRDPFDGVVLDAEDLAACPPGDLEWLVPQDNLRYLELRGPAVPDIPHSVLERLHAFGRSGRSKQTIHTSQLAQCRGVSISPARQIVGPFAECPELRQVYLGAFGADSLEQFSACHALEILSVSGRRQNLRVVWGVAPARLETLQLTSVFPTVLDGLAGLHRLRRVEFGVSRPPAPAPVVDVAPLASCTSLEYAYLRDAAYFANVDVLVGMPALKLVVVSSGFYAPTDERLGGIPLEVA